jgi:hypothetical protein
LKCRDDGLPNRIFNRDGLCVHRDIERSFESTEECRRGDECKEVGRGGKQDERDAESGREEIQIRPAATTGNGLTGDRHRDESPHDHSQ